MAKDSEELERTVALVNQAIYQSCLMIFEDLETDGKVCCSGHHMAQKVAGYAVKLLRERWVPARSEFGRRENG